MFWRGMDRRTRGQLGVLQRFDQRRTVGGPSDYFLSALQSVWNSFAKGDKEERQEGKDNNYYYYYYYFTLGISGSIRTP